jgi:threonyl-tRNA synthetase
VQAILIPITDRHLNYAREVTNRLKAEGLRVEIDDRGERMNAKIRDAQNQKIPYMLILGDREAADKTVSVMYLNDPEETAPQARETEVAFPVTAV